MPVKKAAKKVKGLSRFTKLNIIVFSLLFAGVGTYLVINSKAAVTAVYPTLDKSSISYGDSVVLGVRSVGAEYCRWLSGDGAPIGETLYNPQAGVYRQIYPKHTTSYTVACYSNIGGGSTMTAGTGTFTVYPKGYISINPSTINRGQSTTVSVRADGAMTCTWAQGEGLAGVTDYNVNVWQNHTVTPSTSQNYSAWCVDTATGTGSSAQPTYTPVTVNQPQNASISNFTASPNPIGNGSGTTTFSWSATGTNSCQIVALDSSWNASGLGASGTRVSPTLTAAKTFRLMCTGLYGGASAQKDVAVGVTAAPVCPSGYTGTPPNCTKIIISDPPPKCPTGYTGTPPNCVKTVTSTNTRVITRTVTAPTNSSDTQRPTVPGNLQAEQAGNGEVDLTWDASTDNVGVVGYTVERSTDGTNWEMLSDSVTDTNYADNTAEFNTKYSYRVSAQDAAGNFSDYAVTDLSTNAFSPNVYADQDSTITSEDGIVTINVPAGALKEDAFCEIKKDSVNSKPKGYKLVAGAYSLDCKNEKGDSITSFEKEATVIMDLKDFKQYKKFAAYSIDGNNLSAISSSFNDKDKTLTFKMKEFQTFAAYGAKGSSMWWIWLLVLLLIGGLIFFILRLRKSGNSDDSYYDTTNYVSMPPTPPVGPAGPQQYTSLPDMVAQGQQPPAGGYPQDPYAGQPQYGQPQPPAGSNGQQQPPQYPGNNQYPPQYPPQ